MRIMDARVGISGPADRHWPNALLAPKMPIQTKHRTEELVGPAIAHGRSVMQESVSRPSQSRAIPFDAAKLDSLMEQAGIDVLVATSKHNVQYLLDAER